HIKNEHIIGFFRAFEEIRSFLLTKNALSSVLNKQLFMGVVGLIATRVREIQKLNPVNKLELYHLIYDQWKGVEGHFNTNRKVLIETKYWMIYRKFISVMEHDQANAVTVLDKFMDEIKEKSWSCFDLHHSLFLAPDEIRTCCKRFFVNGIMKGDVVLLNNSKSDSPDFSEENILNAKRELYLRLNKGEASECNGCPFLEFKSWGGIEKVAPKYLSLEYHSVCNMKCEYCNDTYYGGKKPSYDVYGLIKSIDLSQCESIVWGGGEPTIFQGFSESFTYISDKFPLVKQRVITNATKYIKELNDAIDKDQAITVTSIDAGTREKFIEVRKNKNFDRVINNLVRYSSKNSKNVTIKYIFTDNNNDVEEVYAFVSLIAKNKLSKCNFQISYNFKKEKIDIKSATSAVLLYGLLVKEHCRYVFFDDLLRQRLSAVSSDEYASLINNLDTLGYSDIVANKEHYSEIIIWGAGAQTNLLLNSTMFFKTVKVKFIVDNTPSKINTSLNGIDIFHPEKLLECDTPILISAVQASPRILEVFEQMGISRNRLITGLIL
ncbi:radical SAM protein, partial [Dickeya sp. CFBP 2040]|uniref:radical SAM protein n=1 Tax=Dickeya sp. CFBP 2040 TaxID=2718531 RepID=UPI001446F8D9